jgi:hypothetical protein
MVADLDAASDFRGRNYFPVASSPVYNFSAHWTGCCLL